MTPEQLARFRGVDIPEQAPVDAAALRRDFTRIRDWVDGRAYRPVDCETPDGRALVELMDGVWAAGHGEEG